MGQPKQFLPDEGEQDETLVAPRFDESEAGTAQPVVPLAAVSASDAVEGYAPTSPYGAPPDARRRAWPLSLVILSMLVGSLLGGAGFYLYQRRQLADTAPEATQQQMPQQPAAPAEAARPETQTAAAEETSPLPEQPAADSAGNSTARDTSAGDGPATLRAPARDDEAASPRPDGAVKAAPATAAEARRPAAPVARADDDAAVRPRRAGRDDADDEVRDIDEREARRVDSIIYRRERRRERRERNRRDQQRGPAVDRVRGIFEGQP